MCSTPSRARACPTSVGWSRAIGPPAWGVWKAQPARSVYTALGKPNCWEDGGERRHHGRGRFGGPELSVEAALGGVVEHGDEDLALVGAEGQPGMRAAVQMQELAEAPPRLPAPPVPAAGAALGDEPGRLQREFDEAVGQCHAVVAPRELVEVADIEPGMAVPRAVPLAVEAQDAFDLGERGMPRRRLLASPVE